MDCIIGNELLHRSREFDGHESGDVGDGKSIARDKFAALQRAVQIREEMAHREPTSISERGYLFVVYRTG
jgi:hypothetical protein